MALRKRWDNFVAGQVDVSGEATLPAASYELLSAGENFADQLGRSGLGVQAQKRFCPGRAEQDPGFSAIPVRRRLQKKLNTVHVFLLDNAIIAQALGAFGSCTLNGRLLHWFRNVQVAPPIMMRAVLTLQIRDQLSQLPI